MVVTGGEPPFRDRVVSGGLGLGAGVVLLVARWLEPAVEGHGTHTQLGLSDCTFFFLTGHPCPMCGATTTFALMADFRWWEGLVNQPFAALLFLLTLAVCSVGLAEAVWPRGRWIRLAEAVEPFEGRVAAGMLVLMIAGWTMKIMKL